MATLEKRIYDADQARMVLENPAFARAMADIKQELTEQWMQSPARDEGGREKLWLMVKMADKLELALRASLESGQLAKLEMQHQQTLMQRARSVVGLS